MRLAIACAVALILTGCQAVPHPSAPAWSGDLLHPPPTCFVITTYPPQSECIPNGQ